MIGLPDQRFGRPSWRILYWLAYLAAGWFIFWHHSGSSDEGLTLTAAWNVSRGMLPYRDFFEFYTPGSFYLLGGLFRVFGASYFVARVAALLLLLSGGYALLLVSRDFLAHRLQFAVPLLWISLFAYYPLINHNTFSLIAAVWAWAALVAAVRYRHAGWYAVAGAAAGVSIWMLQTKGAAVVVAAVVAMVLCYRTPWRLLGWYVAGLIASLIPFAYWPLPLLFATLVAFPLQHYAAEADVNWIFFAVAAGVHLVVGVRCWRQHAPRTVLGCWWLGALLIVSTASLPDVHHVISSSWATVPLILWLVVQLENWQSLPRAVLTALPVACLLAVVLVVLTAVPTLTPSRQGLTIGQWLRMENPDIAALTAVVLQHIPPDGRLYAGPFLPGLYFEAKRHNATRFSHLLTSLHPPEFFTQASRDLATNPPALAVVNYRLVQKYGYRRDNPLDAYLAAHYRVLEQRGDIMLLVPAVQ